MQVLVLDHGSRVRMGEAGVLRLPVMTIISGVSAVNGALIGGGVSARGNVSG